MDNKITLSEQCLKVGKLDGKAMIQGFEKDGKTIHQSIYCTKNKKLFPALITVNKGASPYEKHKSAIGKSINDKNFILPRKYIAVFDSEYEINNDSSLWEVVCNNGLFDVWLPEAPLSFFSKSKNDSQNKILLLRIYEINEEFKQGDIKAKTAYDDKLIKRNREVTIKKPIVTDNEFQRIKELLIQSINTIPKKSYWMFQANPKYYDIDQALQDRVDFKWMVKRYKDRIKVGDVAYIWKSGNGGGIVAVTKVISELKLYDDVEQEDVPRVPLKTLKVLEKPILRADLKEHSILSNLLIIKSPQGTNYPVTEEEAEAIEKIMNGPSGKTVGKVESNNNHPKNQILYGPPGTGKTYQTVNYALSIIEKMDLADLNALTQEKDRKELSKRFKNYKDSGQIEFITFHQNYAYEDFIQGLRPDFNNTGNGLSFEKKDGVFKKIADRALEEYKSVKEESKKYVIIIDEINRANISRVFGELITLIEEDKRYGQVNEMEATLPSGDPFCIPPNLYIIGTMNTADKSIALLDIALRRRFEFKKVFPESELVVEDFRDFFKKLNKLIVDEKGPDFQIGHAYLINSNGNKPVLEKVMNKKIIPLLYEYFMNDGEAVNTILQKAGVKTKESFGLYEFESFKKVTITTNIYE
ncbi:MAG: EVE domain-containing protein [Pseudomonadota bacterium]